MKMKKIFLSILFGASLLTSCDMNNNQDGVINIEDGMITMKDVTEGRNGLYAFLRSRCGGGYTTMADLQTDLFIGTGQNGNSYLDFTTGNILSNNGDVEGIWAGLLTGIVQVNYFLEASDRFANENELAGADKTLFDRYVAEAHFIRAFFNYEMMYYFCGNYSAATASNPATGIPLVTNYNPSSDRSTYPGRSSLAETYTAIENDLDVALTGLTAFEATNRTALAPGCGYLNSYTVMALQARVALLKGDYSTAMTKAQTIINSGLFPLTQYNDYVNMWQNDEGDELIFQAFGNLGQKGGIPATGSIYNGVSPTQVKFAPSAALCAAYDIDDIRGVAFIGDQELTYNGATMYSPSFVKYPGNTIYDTGSSSAQQNAPKPFRTSEQYLILAEAAAMSSQSGVANDALNDLRAARIQGYTPQTYNGNTLIQQIRLERAKELVGEGFRLADLRRWDLGFTRDAAYDTDWYPDMVGFILNNATLVYYAPGDHRYVWPIPSSEIETNPQLAGQQNPGY